MSTIKNEAMKKILLAMETINDEEVQLLVDVIEMMCADDPLETANDKTEFIMAQRVYN